MTLLRDYMIEKRIHHTFWCFNENSGDTGGLLTNDFQDWDTEKYEFVEVSLWQDDNGKYIGLDHKIPLGQSGNGISLSEYYSGSPSTNPTTPTVTTDPTTDDNDVVYGDANCDDEVNMADAVLIMQSLANPDKYTLTDEGSANADCSGDKDGITNKDALAIQKYKLGLLQALPE